MITIGQGVVEWVQARVPHCHSGFGPAAGIGVERDGQIIAGMVYHEYRKAYGTVQMSTAAIGPWATRETLRVMFDYPFNQLRCQKIWAVVAARNRKGRVYAEKIGCEQEGYMKRGLGSDDAVLYGMLRENCRWIGVDHAQKIAA